MNVSVTEELKDICRKIVSEGKSEDEWAAVESDDTFQSKNFVGGFDATEMAFCFSYYDLQRREFWFQVTLLEVKEIADDKKTEVAVRPAEK